MKKSEIGAVKDVIHLLYKKRLFASFENKRQILESYLLFGDEYLLEKYGTKIKISDGVHYVSQLDCSQREGVLQSLKKCEYEIIVDIKNRMKLSEK